MESNPEGNNNDQQEIPIGPFFRGLYRSARREVTAYILKKRERFREWRDQSGWKRLKWFAVQILNVVSVLGMTSIMAFLHGGFDSVRQTRFMKWFWWGGLIWFSAYWLFQYCKARKSNYKLPKTPYLMVLVFAVVCYFLYIPSKSFRFAHVEDQQTMRAFLSRNSLDVTALLDKGTFLLRGGETTWSFICFDTALKTQRCKLNQYYPYYIASLLENGQCDEAARAKQQMISEIQADFKSERPWLSTSNCMLQLMENLSRAQSKISDENLPFFKELSHEADICFRQSLTNR